MGMPLPMARRGLLIALRQRITCAHVRLEVGWRAGGAKEPRASLCVWYAFGVTGEENHGPSRRPLAAAPRPRLRSLRASVVLSGYQPRRPNPHFRLTAHAARDASHPILHDRTRVSTRRISFSNTNHATNWNSQGPRGDH